MREAPREQRPRARFAASVPWNGGTRRPWIVLDQVADRWLPPAPVAADQQATRATIGDPGAFRDAALQAGFAHAEVEAIDEKVVWQSAEQLVARCMSWWDLASRVEALQPERRGALMEGAGTTPRRGHPGPIETYGRDHAP